MSRRYWLTPPEVLEDLTRRYGPFDFDPCPCPRPEDYNSLEIPWGQMNYVNPPFRKHDGVGGKGPTAFVHKAIAEAKQGKGSVLVLPVQSYVMHLAAAGAEIVSLGRVKWLEADTKEQMPGPSPICAFVLRGEK
ncbi:MAG: phage N-6-adenine-methyltransferase [Deltaproteobacteria bacterium]|nr:phage N-6-adenine-methyltransferase [Deltaproteobacteria bacterium]